MESSVYISMVSRVSSYLTTGGAEALANVYGTSTVSSELSGIN